MGSVLNEPAAGYYTGLKKEEVAVLQRLHGRNVFRAARSGGFPAVFTSIIKEPMFLVLLAACLLYFILGNSAEGYMMLAAMLLVTAISLYQEIRSSRALEALRRYTAPKATVVREGAAHLVDTEELVPGDILLLSEGDLIPADGTIMEGNDLTVNEALMTGESLPVEKGARPPDNSVYQGTTVNSGKGVMEVTAIGNRTRLGKIGIAVAVHDTPKTRLQRQVDSVVRMLAFFGVIAFAAIFMINFLHSHDLGRSILLGLTLAMAAIPEEIPVAFSSFMALGAFYMSRRGIITRQPQVIEHLGAVSVLCLDKTGTLTENRMKVAMLYDHHTQQLTEASKECQPGEADLLRYAVLASERQPFDSMEKAILEAYVERCPGHAPLPHMAHEYPLEGRPPMMTHVYRSGDGYIAAGKGAPERIMEVCGLPDADLGRLQAHVRNMASSGYRVLGVASAVHAAGRLPDEQDLFKWQFEGLVSLYDPPRENAAHAVARIYDAGVEVKLITGDFPATAAHIAERAGIATSRVVSGEEIMGLSGTSLQNTVKAVNVFARMFPEAKVKVIDALKDSGEIVTMTGDGVNDGPALKAAHIGIAMGKKGTDIARLAADLVITDDNLEMIPEAIMQGRKIYNNLKKAVRYIISIHIPIILSAGLPLILGWKYPAVFTPVHIIFLELIMGPTCSVFFEREPVEAHVMGPASRKREKGLFTDDELLITILQGIILTGGVLWLYTAYMAKGSLELTRTVVFTTLIIANIFLTFVNRSFTENITRTILYKNNLAPWVVLTSLVFLFVVQFVPEVRALFGLTVLGIPDLMICLATALISIGWFELYKTGLYHKDT